jgi:ABC-type lipoprotein release transport system permease subunit
VLAHLLYGVDPGDPGTLTVVALLLALVVLVAAWIPARRAARVDPMTALRMD